MTSYDDPITRQLWYIHKSPRQTLAGIIARPRDIETEKLILERPMYCKDFRYHGYPEESFFHPKRSHKRPLSDEERMRKRMSDSNLYDQNKSQDHDSRDNYHNTRYHDKRPHLYEPDPTRQYSPPPRHQSPPPPQQLPSTTNNRPSEPDRMTDIDFHVRNALQITAKNNFMEKSQYEIEKLKRERKEAVEDIARYKSEQLRKLEEAQAEKKKEYERATKFYFWDAHNLGHGAPKGFGDNRKQKFTEEDTTPRKQQGYSSSLEFHRSLLYSPQPRRSKYIGGAGAPIQTDSGNIETHIHKNPSIHFQDKENIPPALTQQLKKNPPDHNKDNYLQELLQQSQEKDFLNQELKIQELKREIEMLKSKDPYGQPGSGAPNVSKSGNKVITHLKHYLTKEPSELHRIQNRESFTDRKESDTYKPWGKGYGQIPRDIEGNVVGRGFCNCQFIFGEGKDCDNNKECDYCKSNSSNETKNGVYEDSAECTESEESVVVEEENVPFQYQKDNCEDLVDNPPQCQSTSPETDQNIEYVPIIDEQGNTIGYVTRKLNQYLDVSDVGSHKSPRRRYIEDESGDPYFPFGRPGAGAPIRDVDGNVITAMKNQVDRNTSSAEARKKARAARAYFEELQHEEKEQKLVRQELERHHKAPIGEFASIIKEGQVGKPRRDPVTGLLLNQHLGISDVSKFKMNHSYKDEDEMRMYHDDLSKQADDRHRMRELNRLKEKQMSKQHYDVMGDYWGRYGGGAPKDPNVRKKAALNETLYSPGRTQVPHRVSEIHEPPKQKVLPQYVRSVVPSTHKNNYDYSDQGRENRYGPPYATSG